MTSLDCFFQEFLALASKPEYSGLSIVLSAGDPSTQDSACSAKSAVGEGSENEMAMASDLLGYTVARHLIINGQPKGKGVAAFMTSVASANEALHQYFNNGLQGLNKESKS